MNAPRVYKHSPWNWAAVALLVVIFAASMFGMFLSKEFISTYFLLGTLALLIIFSSYSLTMKTIVSNDEISTTTLFGSKTLRWDEVSRVTGNGFGIKLQNFNGDVTVVPSQQIPDYEEIVEIVGAKRPDLFSPQEYSEMSRSWAGAWIFAIFFIIGFGFFVFSIFEVEALILPGATFAILGIVLLVMAVLAPQSISIQGNSITVRYLFKQARLTAAEISSITLGYTQARNGKNFYVQINKAAGGEIHIPSMRPSLPIVYHVLKNWHKKNTVVH